MTQEEIQREQQTEAQFNALSAQIIQMTGAWGQFYGLMRSAASMGEGMLNYQICVDQQGRPIKVARTKGGRLVQVMIKPTHEYVTRMIARKKYGKAIFHAHVAPLGITKLIEVVKLQRAKCYNIKPNDFLRIAQRQGRVPDRQEQGEYEIRDARFSNTQIVLLTATTVGILTTTAILLARANKK